MIQTFVTEGSELKSWSSVILHSCSNDGGSGAGQCVGTSLVGPPENRRRSLDVTTDRKMTCSAVLGNAVGSQTLSLMKASKLPQPIATAATEITKYMTASKTYFVMCSTVICLSKSFIYRISQIENVLAN